jgi:hypothetical protein
MGRNRDDLRNYHKIKQSCKLDELHQYISVLLDTKSIHLNQSKLCKSYFHWFGSMLGNSKKACKEHLDYFSIHIVQRFHTTYNQYLLGKMSNHHLLHKDILLSYYIQDPIRMFDLKTRKYQFLHTIGIPIQRYKYHRKHSYHMHIVWLV